jgi:hypothetical protein
MNSFAHPVQAVQLFSPAAVTGTVITLQNSGGPSFLFTFVLPRDYAANKEVNIVIYLSTISASACQARFAPFELIRKRPGFAAVSSLNGLRGGNPLVNFSPEIIRTKTFALLPGGPLAGQKPGDAITLGLGRATDDENDTCASVFVHAIDIRYTIP